MAAGRAPAPSDERRSEREGAGERRRAANAGEGGTRAAEYCTTRCRLAFAASMRWCADAGGGVRCSSGPPGSVQAYSRSSMHDCAYDNLTEIQSTGVMPCTQWGQLTTCVCCDALGYGVRAFPTCGSHARWSTRT